jgi:hypothetical protein
MNQIFTDQLVSLWQKLLGTPPVEAQFGLWAELHTAEVIRKGILHTAAKNLSLGSTMGFDYKIRFASKVMNTQTRKNADIAMSKQCAELKGAQL